MTRTQIPPATANLILFQGNRTCCVCRVPRKPVQIHHIDGDATNHNEANLAIVCLECHDDTLVAGGFGRRLNPDLIRLFRDDWKQRVAAQRDIGATAGTIFDPKEPDPDPDNSSIAQPSPVDRMTEGETLLREAAATGDLNAACNLGAFLDRLGHKEEGEQWLTRAAEAGHLGAATNLGVLFSEAGDYESAARWLAQVAERGGENAAFNLV
jgi:hypothetical protein